MRDAPDVLDRFHPVVASWFRQRFGAPTEPQLRGWPVIADGQDALIAAPTGSGKTLAAFLACIDELIVRGLDAGLPDGTQILYISPLKALSNDVYRNLEQPLAELRVTAREHGIELPPITAAVRTGDTPASERNRMAKKPPHILITTPESLYILLTAERSRAALSTVKTVIVDEIHAVAPSKRGAHLTLSLERLDRLVTARTGEPPVRVGLSATQKPIELIARMLVGARRDLPTIIDGGHAREIDIAIEIIDDELGAVASHEQFGRVYDRIAELVAQHETTLVFVNTRKLVERVTYNLEQRLGADQVVAHHGSMSRKMRFAAEQKLKHGNVRCAVATASLELGIDVGSVDLVVQIGSPRSISTLLQRIGRSGHNLRAVPKGRLFAMTRDQLVECAALVRAVRALELDAICPRDAPLDILSQQIVATTACEDLGEDELFDMVRGASNYAELTRADFDAIITMLSEGVSDRRGRSRAHLYRDRVNGRVKARRGARLSAITSGGAIPDNANYQVVLYPDDTRIGELEEDFAIESMAGDVFLLGNTPWQIRRVESGRVIVEDARGKSPTIPFWLGEAPARTRELCDEVSALRAEVDRRLGGGQGRAEIAEWVAGEACMPRTGADQLVGYLAAGRAALGAIPTKTTIVLERFFDEAGGMQLIVHAPVGGRVNRAWGLALRKRFCRSFDFELQAAATDDGIVISLGQPHSFPLEDVARFLQSESVERILIQAMLPAPMFGVRWRWNATRSLALLRRNGGKRVPPFLLRMRADDLMSTVFPQQQACQENVVGDIAIPDHPLVNETVRDCLTEAMDVDGLRALIAGIESGDITVLARDTVEPSPLCHELLNAYPYAFLDDAPLEERRSRAVSLRRGLDKNLGDDLGALDPAAIEAAENEARPTVRDVDELHDALLSLYIMPDGYAGPDRPQWEAWLDELIADNRATRLRWDDRVAWVAAERMPIVAAAIPGAMQAPVLPVLPFEVDVPDEPITRIVGAYLDYCGPRTTAGLADELGVDVRLIDAAVLALETDGAIMRGSFTAAAAGGITEWCNRRILARIHRLTLARLRSDVQPVSAAALMRFLFRWQRVSRGHQLIGIEGLERVIDQLQGWEAAAGAWERELLTARLHDYQQSWLDGLCLSGHAAWCRLSPRMGSTTAPTKAAPLAIMMRADMPWLRAPAASSTCAIADLGDSARAVYEQLDQRGASFLAELVDATELSAEQVEDGLWELVAAGLASADGFGSLRVLVDRRRRGQTRSHFDRRLERDDDGPRSRRWNAAIKKARGRDSRRPSHQLRALPTAAGRWSLLRAPDPEAVDAEATARQLLARYGVVFRDLLDRESNLPPWREILMALRRLEARGEIRGGRFVAGFVGEQFALPEAVEGLRAVRNVPAGIELVRVAGPDPLNMVGVTSKGPKVPAVTGNAVLYLNGVAIASLEGGEVIVRHPLDDGARVDADLVYHPPPRREPRPQVELPLM